LAPLAAIASKKPVGSPWRILIHGECHNYMFELYVKQIRFLSFALLLPLGARIQRGLFRAPLLSQQSRPTFRSF
jgi:hypothetical protein